MDRVTHNSTGMNSTYIGFVKEVVDLKYAGRLLVWIPELNSSEEDPDGWILCNYCSPFAGATNWEGISQNVHDSHEMTQTSYGFWAIPPDKNNEVLVMFPNNDINRAIWVGCIYNEFMNNMVPESPYVSRNKNVDGTDVPTVEYNKYDNSSGDASNPINAVRPWNKYKTFGLGRKGLIKDKIRGLSSSSSMRETPSKVFGISTPGQLIDGSGKARKGGHSFIMDDSEGNEHISLTTNSGSKIRIDDTNGLIYIINRDGTSWVQMDADGNVDIFSGKSMSVRAKENMNFRADKDIVFEAGQNIMMKAAKDTDEDISYVGEGNGVGGDILINALNDHHTVISESKFETVINGNKNLEILNGSNLSYISENVETTIDGDHREKVSGELDIISGNHKHKTGSYDIDSSGAYRQSSSSIDITSSGQATISASALSLTAGPLSIDPSGIVKATTVIAATVSGGTVSGGSITGGSVKSASADLDDLANHTHQVSYTWTSSSGAAVVTSDPLTSSGDSVTTPSDPSPQSPSGPQSPSEAIKGTSAATPMKLSKMDVLHSFSKTKNVNDGGENLEIPDWWERDTLEMETTITRLMTYEPCPEHIKKGT